MWKFQMPGTLETREQDLEVLWDAGASGMEERDGQVVAYFENRAEVPFDGSWTEEPEQDWQAQFKANLRPVRAGPFTIVPPWLTADVPAGSAPLVIEVGMAFGTGHHETTRMAVEALAELDFGSAGEAAGGQRGARVLDVGTGSGVLALAAALLGAVVSVGVDIDPITIPAALENAALNGFEVEGERATHPEGGVTVTFVEGTLDDLPEELGVLPADVLVANLYAELHDTLMGQYRDAVRPGARVVLTGILVDRLPIVLGALEREEFGDVAVRMENEWALVTARA